MDITPIVNAIIALIAAIISVVVVPQLKKYLDAKLSKEQQEQLEKAIQIAVQAAEQIYKNKPQSGTSKKEYVLKLLADKGWKVNTEEINALVEAKVNELFGKND